MAGRRPRSPGGGGLTEVRCARKLASGSELEGAQFSLLDGGILVRLQDRVVFPFLFCLLAAGTGGTAPAQTPYGFGHPGAGGIVPRLASETPWIGNTAMGYRLSNARGGSTAAIVFSFAPGSAASGATPVFVSLAPQDLIAIRVFSVGGPAGVPGAGVGFFPTPLVPGLNPAIAGLEVFVQAAILDDLASGSVAATQALHQVVRLFPTVFVGDSSPTHWFVDPVAGGLLSAAGTGQSQDATDSEFVDGGKTLFVSRATGGSVLRADTASFPETWTTFFTTAGGAAFGIEYDALDRILYVLGDHGSGHREVAAVDAVDTSPTFGQIVAVSSTNGALDLVERWGMSRIPRVGAFADVGVANLYIMDLEPSSPSYLSIVTTTPVNDPPPSFSIGVVDVDISSDASMAVVTFGTFGQGGRVARYDLTNGKWIDHSASMLGIQNIGPNSTPAVALPAIPSSAALSDDGDFLVVAGQGPLAVPFAVRLDIPHRSPSVISAVDYGLATTAPPFLLPTAVGISPDGGAVAMGLINSPVFAPATARILILDARTGLLQRQVLSPGAVDIQTVSWR